MSKPDPPQPPNPYQTAAAQTGTNVATGVANAFLNNVNQRTPEGALDYNVTGTHSWTDPSTGHTYNIPRFTSTQSLANSPLTGTPYQAMTKENQQQTAYQMAAMASAQSGRISNLLSTPFNPTASAPGGGNAQNLAGVPGAQTSFDAGGPITKSYGPGDFSQDRQRVEDSLMARMNPQLARERGNVEQRLADQGIRYGSQAYTSAMDDYNRQATDTRFGAISQAGQEQERMMGMAAQRAGFENTAQGQQFQQNAAQGAFYNAGQAQNLAQQQSIFNASNAARNQYMQEQYQQRNQPLNEIAALSSGSQLQQPNWLNSPQSQIPTTDFAGIMNQNFQNQMGIYGQQNQNYQQLMGGILGLGAGAMKMSDRREKKNVDRIGTVFAADPKGERKKLPIYEYEYKDDSSAADGARHVGPMAQDVERIDKRAVQNIAGRKMIDTGHVMGSILRAA